MGGILSHVVPVPMCVYADIEQTYHKHDILVRQFQNSLRHFLRVCCRHVGRHVANMLTRQTHFCRLDPFFDTKKIRHSQLSKSKSKLEGYDLGSMCKYIKGKYLNGAHKSLIDVKAQTCILVNKSLLDSSIEVLLSLPILTVECKQVRSSLLIVRNAFST